MRHWEVEGRVADTDGQCGNGATWRVELQSAVAAQRPGAAISIRRRVLPVATGNVLYLVVGPRDGNHSCDTTHVEWRIAEVTGKQRVWDLAADIVDDVLVSNPLADAFRIPGHLGTLVQSKSADSGITRPAYINARSMAGGRRSEPASGR